VRDFLLPDWPAPPGVRAATTLRTGGSSRAPFDTFNLAAHVGDDPADVLRNREKLVRDLGLPAEPHWLSQVHGTDVVQLQAPSMALAPATGRSPPAADASWTDCHGQVCAVLTADCMPVLLAARDASRVAVAHAGWRGLSAGVLENTVRALDVPGEQLVAWMGPAIEAERFEVGGEVREAFMRQDAAASAAFLPLAGGKWHADLHALARQRLLALGIRDVHGGGRGTFRERAQFFSHRRDGRCGRMATLIWLE
jgi:polyphenol oxidase